LGGDRRLDVIEREAEVEQALRLIAGDIAARIGGDEFAVLLNGIGSVQEADDAAERIAVAVRKTMLIDDSEIDACSWQRDSLYDRIQMSVNISGREFSHHAFLDDLSALVAASGVSPHCLRLEITEGASMEQSDAVRAMMATIRSIGISIDIDNFGTGYSSLQALQRIDVDALKIDASFVASIGSVATVVLDAVIGLAHDLGTIAIAEGIETDEQLAYLISVGCELGQGFLFSGPLNGPDALLHAVSLIKSPRRMHAFQE
jgi:EAL domain-containing protein (putative c-di-GMP-specific phosphodiesterase class I)